MSSARERVALQGLVAGLLAYITVALVFAAADLLTGRGLFHTPAVVGGLLFFGASDAASVAIGAGPVIAANGLHIVLAMTIGLLAAIIVEETERHPRLFYISFLAVVLFLLASSAILIGIPSALAGAAPWTVTLVANLAGALVAGVYLWRAHPALRSMLDADDADEAAGPGSAAGTSSA